MQDQLETKDLAKFGDFSLFVDIVRDKLKCTKDDAVLIYPDGDEINVGIIDIGPSNVYYL